MNDLWSWDAGRRQWAYPNGTLALNGAGTPGAINIPSGANLPRARYIHAMVVDTRKRVYYVFGGQDAAWSKSLF